MISSTIPPSVADATPRKPARQATIAARASVRILFLLGRELDANRIVSVLSVWWQGLGRQGIGCLRIEV